MSQHIQRVEGIKQNVQPRRLHLAKSSSESKRRSRKQPENKKMAINAYL